jgi:hypothetical protein
MHRPRTPRSCDANGARDIATERCAALRRPRRFHRRRGHLGLAHFLERSFSDLAHGRVTGQHDERRLRSERGVERAHAVRVPGPAGEQRDTRDTGQPSPGIGHVYRGALVARVHDREARVRRRVVHRHDVIP